jgi:hypothetical protein
MKLHEVTDINEGPLDIFRRSGNKPVVHRGAAGTSHEGFTFTGTKRGGARITMPNGRTKTISSQSPAEVEKIVNAYNAKYRPEFKVEPRLTATSPHRPNRNAAAAPNVGSAKAPDLDIDNLPSLRNTSLDDAPTSKMSQLRADPKPPVPSNTSEIRDHMKSKEYKFVKAKLRAAMKFGGPFGRILELGFSAVQIEELMDQLLRTYINEYARLINEGTDSGMNFQDAATAAEAQLPTPLMNQQHDEIVAEMVEFVIKMCFGLVVTRVSAGVLAGAMAAVIGTGPVGWITALVAGGLIGFYGVEWLYELLEDQGFMSGITDAAKETLSWPRMLSVMGRVDNMFNDNPITSEPTESIIESSESKQQFAAALKSKIQSDPKLIKAYRKGKPKGVAVVQAIKSKAQ